MGFRNARRPRLELLEPKTVMSAGVAAGAGAVALAPEAPAAAKLARPAEQVVSLTGQADGDYTSTQNKDNTGIKYQLSGASGAITPIGSAVVKGWFHTPPEIYTFSARADKSVNPAGPVRGPSTVNSGSPMIPKGSPIVDYFTFTITRGTGQYAQDRGTGTVEVAINPRLTGQLVSGIDTSSSTAPSDHGSGQTTLTFIIGMVPLPFS
jgi:hypothetical protein